MMCLEYAESDLQKMLHKDDEMYGDYSQDLMVTLAVEIARGLAYIHSMDKMHLDLKPENVLLARDRSNGWIAKVADFGAQVDIERASADRNAINAIGTWEYMPPSAGSPSSANPASLPTFSPLG
eukprot:COSAG04_NODE_690_length_11140_cov_13.093651_10_plen_124_part_00